MKISALNFGFKIAQWLANGETVDGEVVNSSFWSVIMDGLATGVLWIWNLLMTFFYWIIKFALNIVDLLQYFVQRLVGIDYWLDANSGLSELGKSDVLFKFMLSDPVQRVFRLLIIVAIVLLIVFSIIAIVKNEYNNASSDKPGSKKGIFQNAMKAIFMVAIIPIILISGVLASNAILASLLNAITPASNNLTMGGQIFVASAYGANRYRLYTDEDTRRPVTYTYNFTYNYAEGQLSVDGEPDVTGAFFGVVGESTVYFIPNDRNGRPDYLGGEIRVLKISGNDTYVIDNDAEKSIESGTEVDSGIPSTAVSADVQLNADDILLAHQVEGKWLNVACSSTRYTTINSLLKAVNPSDYGPSNQLYGFLYRLKDDDSLIPNVYIAPFNAADGINKLATYHYLKNEFGAIVITSNLGIMSSVASVNSDFFANITNGFNGIVSLIESLGMSAEGRAWLTVPISLDSCSQAHPLVISAYNTWPLAKSYKDYSYRFDKTIVAEPTTWRAASGRTFNSAMRFVNNSDTWGMFDGGRYGYVPAKVEYDIMADFIDFAVRYGVEVSVVNSQSLLIDWSSVNMDNYFDNTATKLKELHNNYADIGSVVYKPTNSEREDCGAIYLMCVYNPATGKYTPIQNGTSFTTQTGDFTFRSGFYGSKNSGLIIARGVFDTDYKLQPTVITEKYNIDIDGKFISSGTPQFANLRADTVTTNSIERVQKLSVILADSSNMIQESQIYSSDPNLSGVMNYSYNARRWFDVTGGAPVYANNEVFELVKDAIFPDTLYNGYSYAVSHDDSIVCDSDGVITVTLTNSSNETVYLTMSPVLTSYVDAFEGFLLQMKDASNEYFFDAALCSMIKLGLYNDYKAYDINTISSGCGLLSIPSLSSPPTMQDIFGDETLKANYASSAAVYLRQMSSIIMNIDSVLDRLEISVGAAGSSALPSDHDIVALSNESTLTSYRVWEGPARTGYVFDIYISSGNICIIPYHTYRTTGSVTENGINGLNIVDINGYNTVNGQNLAYVDYNNNNYKMRYVDTPSGVRYVYATEVVSNFVTTKYVIDYYDGFAFRSKTDLPTNTNIYNFKTAPADESGTRISSDAEVAQPISSYSFELPSDQISDSEGNIIYGLTTKKPLLSNTTTAYIYSGGQIVAKFALLFTSSDFEPSVTMNGIINWQTSINSINYIMSLTSQGQELYPVPSYSIREVLTEELFRPSYLVYLHEKISTDFLATDINFTNGLSAIRLYVRLGTRAEVDTDYVFKIDDGSFKLDYNFNKKTGLGLSNIYQPYKLNVIILVFSTVLVFKILMQTAWGLVKRIYDITILFMVMPGFASTMVIDGGERFNKWKDKLIKSVFSAYGVLIGLNIFFVLVPIIDGAVDNLFTFEDLPSTLTGASLFVSALPSTLSASGLSFGGLSKLAANIAFTLPYLNELVKIMFTLVALTLMQSLPGMISDITGFGDAYKDGGKVTKDVKDMVKEVTDVTSGKNALDTAKKWLPSIDDKGKFHLGKLGDFIPGSAIFGALADGTSKWGDRLSALRDKGEAEGKKQPPSSQQFVQSSGGDADPTTPVNNASHSSNSDVAGLASGVSQVEDNDMREMTGERQMTGPLPLVDTESTENEMAKFIQDGMAADAAGDSNARNTAYQGYQDSARNLLEQNLNNAMASGEGEFSVREENLEEIKKGLGEGFDAVAFKTGEKDPFTGNSIWAVQVAKSTGLGIKDENNLINGINTAEKDIQEARKTMGILEHDRSSAEIHAKEFKTQLDGAFANSSDFDQYMKLSDRNDKFKADMHNLNGKLDRSTELRGNYIEKNNNIQREMNNLQSKLSGPDVSKLSETDVKQMTNRIDELKRFRDNNNQAISVLDQSINRTTDARDKIAKRVDEYNSQMKGLIKSNDVAGTQDLCDKYKTSVATAKGCSEAQANLEKDIEKLSVEKAQKEQSLTTLRNTRGNELRTRAKDAGERYEKAINRQDDLVQLENAFKTGKMTDEHKAKAADTYVKAHYGSADAQKQDEIKKQILTDGGISKLRTEATKEATRQAAISDGLQTKANKYTGQHEDSWVSAANARRSGSSTHPNNTSSGGSASSTTSNSTTSNNSTSNSTTSNSTTSNSTTSNNTTSNNTTSNSTTSNSTTSNSTTSNSTTSNNTTSNSTTSNNTTSNSTTSNNTTSSSSTSGSTTPKTVGEKIVAGVKNFGTTVKKKAGSVVKGAARKIDNFGDSVADKVDELGKKASAKVGAIKSEVKRVLKPKSQGDKLTKLYEQSLKAEAAGKARKVKRLNKKMVNVAAESKTIREDADKEYIKNISKASGKTLNTYEEAKAEADKLKSSGTASADTIKRIDKAEKQRKSNYEQSKLGSGKRKNADYNSAMDATRTVAQKQVGKALKSYNKKVDNSQHTGLNRVVTGIKRKVTRTTAPTTSQNATAVTKTNQEHEQFRQLLIKEGYGDINNMTDKEIKAVITRRSAANGASSKVRRKASKSVIKRKNTVDAMNEAKTELKQNKGSRAINSLNIDDQI